MSSNKNVALSRLQKVIDEIPKLEKLPYDSSEFVKWKRNAEVTIVRTFGESERHVSDFTAVKYSLTWFTIATPDHEFQEAYVTGLRTARAVLESMMEEVREDWNDDEEKSQSAVNGGRREAKRSDEIFIVHGRDEAAKETVARFLDRLQLKPVILHEKPNAGRTIVEKFEDHGRVGFAIVLLTPDDVGGLQDSDTQQPRARQNVIFELGYFVGRFGRARVCALKKGELEIPSDYDGVLYIPMDDSGGWQLKLAKELKNAGFNIDMNRDL